MTKKTASELQLESKYRFIVKIGLMVTLVIVVLVDAIFKDFQTSVQVELALVAAIAGIETREQIQKKRYSKTIRRKRNGN